MHQQVRRPRNIIDNRDRFETYALPEPNPAVVLHIRIDGQPFPAQDARRMIIKQPRSSRSHATPTGVGRQHQVESALPAVIGRVAEDQTDIGVAMPNDVRLSRDQAPTKVRVDNLGVGKREPPNLGRTSRRPRSRRTLGRPQS